jgi:hypothetical protein
VDGAQAEFARPTHYSQTFGRGQLTLRFGAD